MSCVFSRSETLASSRDATLRSRSSRARAPAARATARGARTSYLDKLERREPWLLVEQQRGEPLDRHAVLLGQLVPEAERTDVDLVERAREAERAIVVGAARHLSRRSRARGEQRETGPSSSCAGG